ncbi:MAG: DUF4292 domain-containing protein [Bacteroidales bacterium]|nr:DUF4292 domain-containing protein [Bacteroidales bacterium]
MNRRLISVLAIVAVVWIFAACRTTRPVSAVTDEQPASIPVSLAKHRTYTQIQFTASVSGIGVSGQMRVAQDSAIWVSVSKFIEVGRALALADSVYVNAPLFDMVRSVDYSVASRRLGRKIDYSTLQQAVLATDAEQRVAALAAELGFAIDLHITSRREVESLSFPYNKTSSR